MVWPRAYLSASSGPVIGYPDPGIHRPTGVNVLLAKVGVAVGVLLEALFGRRLCACWLRPLGALGFSREASLAITANVKTETAVIAAIRFMEHTSALALTTAVRQHFSRVSGLRPHDFWRPKSLTPEVALLNWFSPVLLSGVLPLVPSPVCTRHNICTHCRRR